MFWPGHLSYAAGCCDCFLEPDAVKKSKLQCLTPTVSVYGISHLHLYINGHVTGERDDGVIILAAGQEGEICSVVSPCSNTVRAGSPRVLYCNSTQALFLLQKKAFPICSVILLSMLCLILKKKKYISFIVFNMYIQIECILTFV